jgi:hypothetical protein
MSQDKNLIMKKFLQKIVDHLLSYKKYKDFDNVEVFFVFGSNYKTAMCDWVYGMKIYTSVPHSQRNSLVKEFQMDIRKKTDNFFKQSVCSTDIVFEKV